MREVFTSVPTASCFDPGRFPVGQNRVQACGSGTVTIALKAGNYYSSLGAIEPKGSHNPESRSYRGS